MNNIDKIAAEFESCFTDIYKDKYGGVEGAVQHPVYGGMVTHCRSSVYWITKILAAKKICEIGTWLADSAFMMANAQDDLNFGNDAYIDTIDIMVGGYTNTPIKYNHKRIHYHYWRPFHTNYDEFKYNAAGIVHKDFKHMTNQQIFDKNYEYLSSIASKDGYSFILIDGDHGLDGVRLDWELVQDFAREDTVIMIDDLRDERHWQVKQFWDSLDTYKYDFEDFIDDTGILISAGVTLKS